MEFYGTIKILNVRTLQSWIDRGLFQKEIANGYTYAPACGRFVKGKCECCRCRKPNGGWERKKVLEINKHKLA